LKTRKQTIQSSFFRTYSLIIVLVGSAISLLFYGRTALILRNRAFDYMEERAASVAVDLEDEIRKLDDVSMDILYSSIVKEQFRTYLSSNSSSASGTGSSSDAEEIIETFTVINGPSRPAIQINLYESGEGTMIGSGFDNRKKTVRVEDQAWYGQVVAQDGKKVIIGPHADPELSQLSTNLKNGIFVSLCRLFFDRYGTARGVVEVVQRYETVFQSALGTSAGASAGKVFAFDGRGTLLFPSGAAEEPIVQTARLARIGSDGSDRGAFKNQDGSRWYLTKVHSSYLDWTVVLAVEEKVLLAPLRSYGFTIAPLLVTLLLSALALSFLAARRLTTPIKALRNEIRSTTLRNRDPLSQDGSGISEVDELAEAFGVLRRELSLSMDQLLQSQAHEHRARLLALQSQMNPHFIYNTFATIAAMAEEGKTEEVTEVCEAVSDMLRYVSASTSAFVELEAELEYARRYLQCMKARFGNKLSFQIRDDGAVRGILVPKLVVQPLVENALKHGTRGEPPWRVQIEAARDQRSWIVRVSDDGPGFSEEAKDHLAGLMADIRRGEADPELEVEGLGLPNLFARLHLAYGLAARFSVGEGDGGSGSAVEIGGNIGEPIY